MSKRILILLAIALLMLSLLGACAGAAAPVSHLSLAAPKTSKPVSKAIESFKVTLTNEGETDEDIDLSLDTIRGADWKAALCYEEFCFMHDGHATTYHTLPMSAGEARELEIKLFLPGDVRSGETKTLKLAAVTNHSAATSVEFEGVVP